MSPLPYREDAFKAANADDALKAMNGNAAASASDQITLDVPIFAESSAMVPVTVSSTLPDVTAIHIVVRNNPNPLAMSFEILPGALPHVSTRVWLAKDSDVVAYVKSLGQLYFTSVDVMLQSKDGCITHKLG